MHSGKYHLPTNSIMFWWTPSLFYFHYKVLEEQLLVYFDRIIQLHSTFTGDDSMGDTPLSPDAEINELQGLSPEEQVKQKQAWTQELANVSHHSVDSLPPRLLTQLTITSANTYSETSSIFTSVSIFFKSGRERNPNIACRISRKGENCTGAEEETRFQCVERIAR